MAGVHFDLLAALAVGYSYAMACLKLEHLDYRLAELKSDLIKWVVGLALAQTGLLVGILLKLS